MGRIKIASLIQGIIIGIVASLFFYLLHVLIFHGSTLEFYTFAGLALLGGPLIGGTLSALKAKEHKRMAFLFSGCAVFVLLLILSVSYYMVLPLISYGSAQVPAYALDASNFSSHIPSSLNYPVPGIGIGTLLAGDSSSAVAVVTDYAHYPYASTVYLINKSENKVIRSMYFNNDIIGAAIDDGTLYLFNDKIGYTIDTQTGGYVNDLIRIDNYRGIYTSGNNTYVQTTLEISEINEDGSVSHRRMDMRVIAYGCLLS